MDEHLLVVGQPVAVVMVADRLVEKDRMAASFGLVAGRLRLGLVTRKKGRQLEAEVEAMADRSVVVALVLVVLVRKTAEGLLSVAFHYAEDKECCSANSAEEEALVGVDVALEEASVLMLLLAE